MDPANVNSYPVTGLTWSDLSRNMNSGNLVGGFTYDSLSKSFNAVGATSTTSAWISTNTTLSFTDTSAYSMEFTVKLFSNAQNTSHSLCGNGQTNPWVGISGNGTSWKFFFRDADSGATYSYSSTITNYDISQKWATLCYTVATNRNIRFYINGLYISNTSPIPTTTLLNVSRLAGGYSSGGNSYPFQGYISTTRIYNRVLTDTEILQNHNTIKSRFRL
jgi:hypothetical protein